MSRIIDNFEDYVLQHSINNPEFFETCAICFSILAIIMLLISTITFVNGREKLSGYSPLLTFFSCYFAIFFSSPKLCVAITICIIVFCIIYILLVILVWISAYKKH